MKEQRIPSEATALLVGRVYDRANQSTLTTGYDQQKGIENMYHQTLECHAATELPYDGMRRWSRAALLVVSQLADKKAP